MLDASGTPAPSNSPVSAPVSAPVSDPASDSVLASHELIERLQAQVKFENTRNEALN